MKLNPYLLFDGKCEEAFKTYQKVLGGEIVAMIPHEGRAWRQNGARRLSTRRSSATAWS